MGVIDCKILSQIWFVVFRLLATRCCLPVTLIRTLHKLLHVIPDYSSHHPLHWLHTAATGLPSIVCVYYSPSDSNFTEPFHVSWAVPILDFWGPYAKLCRRPGGGGWMKRICPCSTPSRIALAEGARETVSLRGRLSARFFFFFFFLKQETVSDCVCTSPGLLPVCRFPVCLTLRIKFVVDWLTPVFGILFCLALFNLVCQ